MAKKRIRIVAKKQKIVESKVSKTSSLEQTVREPTFFPGRARTRAFPLALPFGTLGEQAPQAKPVSERTEKSEPEATSREAFSYERPGGTSTSNSTTYRIPGATDQTDNQVYRSGGQENAIEKDRDRFKPLAGSTDRLRDTPELGKNAQERYQGAQQTYQSEKNEKKSNKELERSRF